MIELDGIEYTVDDTSTIAYNMLAYINKYMSDNNIKGKDGNIVQFKINLSSPIWLIIFGLSYMVHVLQKIMYACGQSFSIPNCADSQVLGLAQIARLQRKQGAYTTIEARITASSAGDCAITTSLSATATYNSTDYTFNPIYAQTIPAGTTVTVILICTVTGPVYINTDTITSFETNPVNFGSMTTAASIPGTDIETISSLRTRLNTNESIIPINGCVDALNALTGVTKANLVFNRSYTETITVEGIDVPPKKTIIFLQGYSDNIAETYLNFLTAETVAVSGTSHSQSFTLQNNQSFIVNYFDPKAVYLYIKVYLSSELTLEQKQLVINQLISYSNSLSMGTNYTQSYLLDTLVSLSIYSYIAGLAVSSDGVNYSVTTAFTPSEIGIISADNISFEVA